MFNNTRRNKEWIQYQKVMFGSLKAETVECIKNTLIDVDVHWKPNISPPPQKKPKNNSTRLCAACTHIHSYSNKTRPTLRKNMMG